MEVKKSIHLSSSDVVIDVPHVQQNSTWDCGLACMKMIMKWLEIDLSNWKSMCSSCGFKTSIWTIDLANLAAHYRVPHLLTTIMVGVNKDYEKEMFYKSSFGAEEKRITQLFQAAAEMNIKFEQKSVPRSDLVTHLASGQPCIALIDWSRLRCKWCSDPLRSLVTCCGTCHLPYQGHFVVLCGYNLGQETFLYLNPGRSQELCCCSMSVFDEARRSYGTDEDILFVYQPHSSMTSPASAMTSATAHVPPDKTVSLSPHADEITKL